MVRCCKALSNPPPSCYNLHKVKIHVRRLRSGNGGSSSCAGNPQPQLESPGPAGSAGGTPNRRARFRYCVVFSALQEWCLKGETREGGWEAFWAGGETAICRAFVWPNYYKAPYALNCQRRACCYMTRGMKRVSFLCPVLHHGENRKINQGLLWNQAKQRGAPGLWSALLGCSSDGIGPPATAVVGGAWQGSGTLGSRTLAQCWEPGTDPTGLKQTAGWQVMSGRKDMECPFLFPCWVSPTSCWESSFMPAETALHLLRCWLVFCFPCFAMHR